ncbi:MAG: hypothetical protein H6872_14750 [Methylobacteriaceae bacterium]|nr:hypothetical protein [Methylobacteriaceae bacterium]
MGASGANAGRPVGFLIILAMAALAFALLLHDAFRYRAGGGDAVLSAAFTIIYDVLMVWTALVVLTAVAAIQGDMPAGGWIAAIVLLPASGAATAAAIDLATRGGRWALVVPCLLPPLVAAYALWARLPGLRAAVPTKAATYGVWGVVLVLSAIAGYAAM